MVCDIVKLGGDGFAVMCSGRRRRRRCYLCSNDSEVVCDFPTGEKTTCDRELCRTHRRKMFGEKEDYCPDHYFEVKKQSIREDQERKG